MEGFDSRGEEIHAQIAQRLDRLLADVKLEQAELAKAPDNLGDIEIIPGRAAADAVLSAVHQLQCTLESVSEQDQKGCQP